MRNRLLVMYSAYLGEGWRAKTSAEKSCRPRQRRRGRTCVVLATLAKARSGKTDRYFICRGGPAVPRAAACGARTAMLWSAGRSDVTGEASVARLSSAHVPQRKNRWLGHFSAFSGIGIDKCSARDPSSDLPDLPIAQSCDTHADPGAGTCVTCDET